MYPCSKRERRICCSMLMRVHVLRKMLHQEISHCDRAVDVKEMYQKECCFAHKTSCFFFSLPHFHRLPCCLSSFLWPTDQNFFCMCYQDLFCPKTCLLPFGKLLIIIVPGNNDNNNNNELYFKSLMSYSSGTMPY